MVCHVWRFWFSQHLIYEVWCISRIVWGEEVHYKSNKVIDQCIRLELLMNPKSQVAATWTNTIPEKLHQLCTLEQEHTECSDCSRDIGCYAEFSHENQVLKHSIKQSIYLYSKIIQNTLTIIRHESTKPRLKQRQLSLNLQKIGAKVNLWQDLPSYDSVRTTSDFKSINEGGKKLQYIINRSYQFLKCDGVCRAHRNVSWWINVQRCEKPQIYSLFKPSSEKLC